MHYYKPLPASVGFGVVIFEDKNGGGIASIAFATENNESVNVTFTLDNRNAISAMIKWFDSRMFNDATRDFVLKNNYISFENAWKEIEENYKSTYLTSTAHNVGRDRVYELAGNLMQDMQSELRAYVVGSAKSPEVWTEDAIKRIKELKEQGKIVRYQAVIGVDANLTPHQAINMKEEIDKRLKKYHAEGIGDQIQLAIIEMQPPLGSDIFIIEDRHVMISLPILANETELQQATVLKNEVAAAKAYIRWFTNEVWRIAVPYDRWLQSKNL
jgi:hypothetical protein